MRRRHSSALYDLSMGFETLSRAEFEETREPRVRMAAMGCARTVLMSHHLSVNNGTCSEPDADMTCCRLAELGLLPFGDSCSKLQTSVPRTFKDEFR